MASYINPCVTNADPHVNMPESVSVVVTTREDNVVSPVTDKVPPIVAFAAIATATPVPVKELFPAKVGTAFTKEVLAILFTGTVRDPCTVNPPLADNNPVVVKVPVSVALETDRAPRVVVPVTAKVPPMVALLVIATALVLVNELTPVKTLVPATVGTAETSEALTTLAAGKVTAPRTVNPPFADVRPVVVKVPEFVVFAREVTPVTARVPPMVQLLVTATPTPTLLKIFDPDKVGTGDTNDAFAMLPEGSEMAPVTVNPLDALIEEQTMADPEVKVPLDPLVPLVPAAPVEPVEPIGPV